MIPNLDVGLRTTDANKFFANPGQEHVAEIYLIVRIFRQIKNCWHSVIENLKLSRNTQPTITA